MRTRTVALGLAALLALLVATACGGGGGGGGPPATVTPAATGSRHVLGSPQAPVELIEYADFQ
jgi:ABC-type glycerol-3-phosphate transport system substrate-binding protein